MFTGTHKAYHSPLVAPGRAQREELETQGLAWRRCQEPVACEPAPAHTRFLGGSHTHRLQTCRGTDRHIPSSLANASSPATRFKGKLTAAAPYFRFRSSAGRRLGYITQALGVSACGGPTRPLVQVCDAHNWAHLPAGKIPADRNGWETGPGIIPIHSGWTHAKAVLTAVGTVSLSGHGGLFFSLHPRVTKERTALWFIKRLGHVPVSGFTSCVHNLCPALAPILVYSDSRQDRDSGPGCGLLASQGLTPSPCRAPWWLHLSWAPGDVHSHPQLGHAASRVWAGTRSWFSGVVLVEVFLGFL